MIPETENPQEAKSVYPGEPARHAQADPVDTLRTVHNAGFITGQLTYTFPHTDSSLADEILKHCDTDKKTMTGFGDELPLSLY